MFLPRLPHLGQERLADAADQRRGLEHPACGRNRLRKTVRLLSSCVGVASFTNYRLRPPFLLAHVRKPDILCSSQIESGA